MSDNQDVYTRKSIAFDLRQEALKKYYPRPIFTLKPNYHKKVYSDIFKFMDKNGYDRAQYSVYASRNAQTLADIYTLFDKLTIQMPWLYKCVTKIDVTNIGQEQYEMRDYLEYRSTIHDAADLERVTT